MGNCCCKRSSEDYNNDYVNFAGGNVQLITPGWEQKMEEARKEGKIVIANFSATWCQPCKRIAPCFSRLSTNPYISKNFMFLLVDVDKSTALKTLFNIKVTPTFLFIKNGELPPLYRVEGAKEELVNKIKEHSPAEEQKKDYWKSLWP